MAVRTTKTLACDRCGSTDDVMRHRHQYVVNNKVTKRFTFDACPGCAESAPIVEWERLTAGAGRRLVRQVVDPSVIEKAAKKAPRKRVVKR